MAMPNPRTSAAPVTRSVVGELDCGSPVVPLERVDATVVARAGRHLVDAGHRGRPLGALPERVLDRAGMAESEEDHPEHGEDARQDHGGQGLGQGERARPRTSCSAVVTGTGLPDAVQVGARWIASPA